MQLTDEQTVSCGGGGAVYLSHELSLESPRRLVLVLLCGCDAKGCEKEKRRE